MTSEDLASLRAELAGQPPAAQARPLLEFARERLARYLRAGPGQPAGRPDLDDAIDAMTEGHGYLDPEDAQRGRTAAALGWNLGIRHVAHAGSDEDRERGIGYLEEALGFKSLPPVMRATGQLVLAQLLLARVTRMLQSGDLLAASMRGGVDARFPADADRAAQCLRLVLAEPLSPDIARTAEVMLKMAEAMRTLLSGFGRGLGGFDVSRMMEAVATLQEIQQEAGAGGSLAPGASVPGFSIFDAQNIVDLDPLDRPVAYVRGSEPVGSEEDGPGTPRPRPAAVEVDRAAVRRERDQILSRLAPPTVEVPGGDPVSAAATLLRPDGPVVPVDTVDELVALATMSVHSGEGADPVAVATDRFVLAVALHRRARHQYPGDREDGDAGAGLESLAAAARMMPAEHPAVVTVLWGLGAFLDEGAPDDWPDGLVERIDAVLGAATATGPERAILYALRGVGAVSSDRRAGQAQRTGYLVQAVAAVPADYPWRDRLRAVAEEARGAAEPDPADLVAALRTVGAAALLWLRPADGDAAKVEVVLLDAVLDAVVGRPELIGTVPATAAAVMEPVLARLGTAPGRVMVAADPPLDRLALGAVRSPDGSWVAETVAFSSVASGAHLVELARREPRPVGEDAVFVANPRGDRESAGVDVMMLRRLFYPRSTGLGQLVEEVGGAGTPAEVLARTSASMLHLDCGLTPAGVPAVELAGPDELDAIALHAWARERAGATHGGLAILPPEAGADPGRFAMLADALLAAGFTGVIGWLGPVAEPVAALMRFILHARLVDDGLPPAHAVAAVQRWMLNPDRPAPSYLPPRCAAVLTDPTLVDPARWAALCHRGR